VESKVGPLDTSATEWPIVPAPSDYDDGEFGGMKIGRGNRSTRRKPPPAPLCPPQILLDQTRVWTRAAAVGSQRLTAWATARPILYTYLGIFTKIHRAVHLQFQSFFFFWHHLIHINLVFQFCKTQYCLRATSRLPWNAASLHVRWV
jgi:hypothetical protein